MNTAMHRFRDFAERANVTLEEFLEFLDSPAGRRLRTMVATGMIVSVPLVMRIPGLRSSPIGRLVEFAGGAALVVKLAEAVRDWERSEAAQRRARAAVDVPPAPPA